MPVWKPSLRPRRAGAIKTNCILQASSRQSKNPLEEKVRREGKRMQLRFSQWPQRKTDRRTWQILSKVYDLPPLQSVHYTHLIIWGTTTTYQLNLYSTLTNGWHKCSLLQGTPQKMLMSQKHHHYHATTSSQNVFATQKIRYGTVFCGVELHHSIYSNYLPAHNISPQCNIMYCVLEYNASQCFTVVQIDDTNQFSFTV